jgi:proton-dependent oligopeptide transporter, POT family
MVAVTAAPAAPTKALFSRAAPPSVNATMIGVFYLLFSAANLMVGWIGGPYGTMTPTTFWSLHAGLCAASTGVLIMLWRPLRSALAPRHGWAH